MQSILAPIDARLIVDLVLVVVLIEAIVVAALLKFDGRTEHYSHFLVPLASGGVLLLALRFAINEPGSLGLLLLLAVAGIAHCWDFRLRWRSLKPKSLEHIRFKDGQKMPVGR